MHLEDAEFSRDCCTQRRVSLLPSYLRLRSNPFQQNRRSHPGNPRPSLMEAQNPLPSKTRYRHTPLLRTLCHRSSNHPSRPHTRLKSLRFEHKPMGNKRSDCRNRVNQYAYPKTSFQQKLLVAWLVQIEFFLAWYIEE